VVTAEEEEAHARNRQARLLSIGLGAAETYGSRHQVGAALYFHHLFR
jgi:hypothetical protein